MRVQTQQFRFKYLHKTCAHYDGSTTAEKQQKRLNYCKVIAALIKSAIMAIFAWIHKKAQREFARERMKGHFTDLPRLLAEFFMKKTKNVKNISPSIFNVPLCTIARRLLIWTAVPSFDHFISGDGVPAARHGNVATLPLGRVWFDGPIWMMGGGMSSTDMT